MPKARKRPPDTLQPYVFHGLDLDWSGRDGQAKCDCPFCGRSKFTVEIKTGKWRCFVCNVSGNASSFLSKFWTVCDKATTNYEELRVDRNLEYPDTLMSWGVVRSITTRNWLVPGYGLKGENRLQQLYQRKQVLEKDQWRWRLLPTPKVSNSKANKNGHRLHGLNLYDKDKSVVYLCEGPWDGMALWELLRQAKSSEKDGLASTANVDRSLLADASVLAVPGCNVFFTEWLPLFADKVVNLMYDNDHPREHPQTGQKIAPAGLRAMERVSRILHSTKKYKPAEVNYLRWGKEHGYDLELPSGHDVRDCLNT